VPVDAGDSEVDVDDVAVDDNDDDDVDADDAAAVDAAPFSAVGVATAVVTVNTSGPIGDWTVDLTTAPVDDDAGWTAPSAKIDSILVIFQKYLKKYNFEFS